MTKAENLSKNIQEDLKVKACLFNGVTVQTVITTTSDESKKASFDSIMCEKELQGLKTTSTEMVEKTWSEDEINNQNGMKL